MIIEIGSTASLKNFMIGSVAKDSRGAPRKVYHGTRAEFTKFRTNWVEGHDWPGIFFTADRTHAENWGPTHTYYLSIKKPLIVSSRHVNYKEGFKYLLPRAKQQGYDGVFVPKYNDMGIATADVYIVWTNKQIWKVV